MEVLDAASHLMKVIYLWTRERPSHPSCQKGAYWKILVSLGGGEKTVSEISRESSLKMTSLPKFLTTLIEYDLIQKKDGRYYIVDKIIRDFFRNYRQSIT